MEEVILQQLSACGLRSDRTVIRQSQRGSLYEAALKKLVAQGKAFPCACSRSDIEQAVLRAGGERQRHSELVYPGTCRAGLTGKAPRSWRFRTSDEPTLWIDRRLGRQAQSVQREVGDFVLKRADGRFAYQLAVVVDDAEQCVTHVVRGEDLCDNTARQIQLQKSLGLPILHYLHTPLVRSDDGYKLSKQNGAQAVETSTPTAAAAALRQAAVSLGLPVDSLADATSHPDPAWVAAWRELWCDPGPQAASINAANAASCVQGTP